MTKPKTTKQKKFYRDLIQKVLANTYRRMERMVATLPLDGVDLDKDTPESRTIKNVLAIEQEWIIDPDLRYELSLIDIQKPPKK
tara:strand:+ start:303 stop:554 length:252 start_codon:yes stop_codon:yes gene_type:complete